VRESRPGSEHLRQIGAHQVAAIMQAAVAFRAVAVELLIPFSSCCRCDRTFSILDAKHVKLVKLVFDVAEDQIRSGPQPSRASSPGANTKLLAAEAPHTSSIWPSSGHIFMFIGIDGALPRGVERGIQNMAFLKTRHTAEHDQSAETDVEGKSANSCAATS
jgi:hypothetical protein